MEFHEFGNPAAPAVLETHGMMQRWQSMYAQLQPLEEHYRLIFIAMDGFYDGSRDFTTFADQAEQIEAYVQSRYGGRLHGAYGASQGGLMLTEVLTRGRIAIDNVIMDGCYVAHQGALSGWVTYWMFRRYARTGRFPAPIHVMMRLMGQKLGDIRPFLKDYLYTSASDVSLRRNFLQNYTYRVRQELAGWQTPVHLWCGSREPYAIKSHRELKRYLPNYTEEIMDGLAHGELLMKQPAALCAKIRETLA